MVFAALLLAGTWLYAAGGDLPVWILWMAAGAALMRALLLRKKDT